jgi:hypothetical protein
MSGFARSYTIATRTGRGYTFIVLSTVVRRGVAHPAMAAPSPRGGAHHLGHAAGNQPRGQGGGSHAQTEYGARVRALAYHARSAGIRPGQSLVGTRAHPTLTARPGGPRPVRRCHQPPRRAGSLAWWRTHSPAISRRIAACWCASRHDPAAPGRRGLSAPRGRSASSWSISIRHSRVMSPHRCTQRIRPRC